MPFGCYNLCDVLFNKIYLLNGTLQTYYVFFHNQFSIVLYYIIEGFFSNYVFEFSIRLWQTIFEFYFFLKRYMDEEWKNKLYFKSNKREAAHEGENKINSNFYIILNIILIIKLFNYKSHFLRFKALQVMNLILIILNVVEENVLTMRIQLYKCWVYYFSSPNIFQQDPPLLEWDQISN